MACMKRIAALAVVLILALGLGLLSAPAALGCPNCKEAVAKKGQESALPAGYNYSIYVMMSAPFVVAAALAGLIVVAARRVSSARSRALSSSPSSSSP